MSVTCLAISSASKSPERASLLAIYLVGLQLPLSGAVLALPEIVSTLCRPFIAAYWGWSGYLKTLSDYAALRHRPAIDRHLHRRFQPVPAGPCPARDGLRRRRLDFRRARARTRS